MYKRATFDEYVKMHVKSLRAATGIPSKNPNPSDPEFAETWEVANREVLELARIGAQEAISDDDLTYGG